MHDDSQGFLNEEDRVNCPFYFKIGACRNGEKCNRQHVRPTVSSVLLLPHLYPATPETMSVSNDEEWDDATYNHAQEHMEMFFEEIFLELGNYGEIEDLVVCDNVSDHMVGNVYVKFFKEEDADKACKSLGKRFYGSTLIQVEFSPVTDFREARCRAFHETRCTRGGFCNFMHIKHVPKAVKRRVVHQMYTEHPEFHGKKPSDPDNPEKDDEVEVVSAKRKKRMSSEERKATIAQWNKERFTTPIPPPPGVPLPPGAVMPPGIPVPPPPLVTVR